MTVRNLDYLFEPKSIAVIGASCRPHAVGHVVMRNLLAAGFAGPVLPVNPKHEAVEGVLAYPDVAALPITPDLAVICTPAELVPGILNALTAKGTRAAVVLTAGLRTSVAPLAAEYAGALQRARAAGMRILGPNCLGVAVPRAGLNATFAHIEPSPGSLAFLSQSGALGTAILDWAAQENVGFSYFVSLGDSSDIDIDDLLDYVSADPKVSGILMYIESIAQARNFMSAARAAARSKTVIAIKAGRAAEGARAAATHTGALAGSDEVYDAAFRRAGMLRVYEIDELFDAAETLSLAKRIHDKRLLILGNGGGMGVMATDTVIQGGGALAELTADQVHQLDAVLPAGWSRGNPIDLVGDADPERYRAALECVLKWDSYGALLVMNVPTAVSDSSEVARIVAELAGPSRKNVLTNWLGGGTAQRARKILSEARVPTYSTPEKAVRAFLHMVWYRDNQLALMETPPVLAGGEEPKTAEAKAVIAQALSEQREMLTEPECKRVLEAYCIPAAPSRIAGSPFEASEIAAQIGFPVALKIFSPEISHKSDVGGVALNLESSKAVQEAAEAMQLRALATVPGARINGYIVQPMVRRPAAHELIVGVNTDVVFGPTIVFGHGGTGVEVIRDTAVGFPPLNRVLAEQLVARTRVSKLLRGYRDQKPANLAAICDTLCRVSQLIIECPEVQELDINPLYADADGVIALDARIRVKPVSEAGINRLAIRPYPRELEESVVLKNGVGVVLRPIRPEDENAHQEFFDRLGPDDIFFRFFGLVKKFPHTEMARFTQLDFDREMAFIAVASEDGKSVTLGVVRAMVDPDKRKAEFAIIVRSDLKGLRLGRILLDKMIRYCRDSGFEFLTGLVKWENHPMLRLADALGFTRSPTEDPGIVEVCLALQTRGSAPGPHP